MTAGNARNLNARTALHLAWITSTALCALVLCSCRGPAAGWPPAGASQAYPGMAAAPCMDVPGPGVRAFNDPCGSCPATSLMGPRPAEEYLCDGGDHDQNAKAMPDWQIRGLDIEDTIAHYDTLDGRRVVEASNRVCIYSPRFSAVRQVVGVRLNEQRHTAGGVSQGQIMRAADETIEVRSGTQNLQTSENTAGALANLFESEQGGGTLAARTELRGFQQDMFLPYENLVAIRTGGYEAAEMARLAEAADAAITWAHDLGVQVIIDRERAAAEIRDEALAAVYTVKQPPANPRLRIIKVASTKDALPGEIVEFTLRFDNVGNQVIGNVTVVDNLTTRLEYVPDSSECSLEANFLAQRNEAESLALRWEILAPMMPGDGGVIRFKCRVR